MIGTEWPLIKSVSNALKGPLSYLRKKLWPPKIGYQLAPSNLLEVVRPYAYKGKIKELLGEPHHKAAGVESYRFADALLQIMYEDDEDIRSVTFVGINPWWPHRFRIHPLSLTLNRSTFADGCGSDALELEKDQSSKFTLYWKTEYFGFPGNYLHFSFGLLEAATWPPTTWDTRPQPDIAGTDMKWILRNPSSVRFNAIAITKKEEGFPFIWSAFQ
ncbi:hypothetical protein [Amantichitinum ursilacus]|uniref:Uncharacterized protein n=1 Tax=Amantichitinum ursilacus TaxID=857265 RepID=A0A0N0GMR1_9NEIS|nr:hypothetical protein [Amantichitinum ursilacus]KPC52009.1 hypothetical protein WG78_13145 [Amantichitinum ursilacus]